MKASKESRVDFLAQFWVFNNEINRKASRPLRLDSLLGYTALMERVERKARESLHDERAALKSGILKSVPVKEQEKKRGFMQYNGEKPPKGCEKCPMCEHTYVDAPPCNKANELKINLPLMRMKF